MGQGKLRLAKWFNSYPEKDKKKLTRDVISLVLARGPKMCSFIEYKDDLKIVYKRYASLFFCCAIESGDNELLTLEIIHHFVELLDLYFGSVCELDIIYNYEKAYFILDEFLLAGEIQETSKKCVLNAIKLQDFVMEEGRRTESLKMLDLANSLYVMSFVQDISIWSQQERLCKIINMKFHLLLGQALKH